MQAPTMKTHARLAALGAVGVSFGALLLYGLLFYISRTSAGGGIDFEHSLLTRISVGVIIAALIAAHLVFARQLLAYAKKHSA